MDYKKIWADNKKALLRSNLKRCNDDIVSQASSYLFIFDFCIIWFCNYADALAVTFLVNSEKNKKDNQHNVSNLISWRICAELIAIRELVLKGLDVPAKQILRSVSENLDALGLAALSTEFCSDFVKDQDVENSNKTWYKHISKGKARKIIRGSTPHDLKFILEEHDLYRNEEETILSAAAHPSFISSFVSLMPNYNETNPSEEIGISGNFSQFSLRTLQYCSYRVLMHCAYDIFLFKTFERYIEDSRYEPIKDLKIFLRAGRKIAITSLALLTALAEAYDSKDSEGSTAS